jgi:hypothetical protein
MPKDHYLPATFLASFSASIRTPRRDSILAVGDVLNGREPFEQKAENVAYINDFYTLKQSIAWSHGKQPGKRIIDETWNHYEPELESAIAAMITGNIDALTWARTLVPFVASLLVRGPEFNHRFESRPVVAAFMQVFPDSPDNTHGGRVIELQRLLGPIACAKWIVAHVADGGKLVTNDVGFMGYINPKTGELGITIPLNSEFLLTLIPRRQGELMLNRNGMWYPIMIYTTRSGRHINLNAAMAAGAQRFVFGSDKKLVANAIAALPNDHVRKPTIEPAAVGFLTGTDAAVHAYTWFRLISFLMRSPNQSDTAPFDIDWSSVGKCWSIVCRSLNRPIYPSALHQISDKVVFDFYDGKRALEGWVSEPVRL